MGFRAGVVRSVVALALALGVTGVDVPQAGAVLVPHSVSVTLSPDELLADGVSTSQATVRVRDALGLPVDRVEIVPVTDGDVTFGPVAAKGNGVYTFTVTASRTTGREFIIVHARVLGQTLAHGSAALSERAGPPASIDLSIPDPHLLAVPGSTTEAVITLRDAEGRGAWGENINVGSDGVGWDRIVDYEDGTYRTRVLSTTKAGVYTVRAFTDSGLEAQHAVTVHPTAPHHVRAELDPDDLPADGASTATLRAWVEDAYDNAIRNTPVQITTDGDVSISDVNQHDCDGYCRSAVVTASTTPGHEGITVTVPGFPVGETVVLHERQPEVGTLALSFDPPTLSADGQSQSTASLTVRDGNGRPVENLMPWLVTDGDLRVVNDWRSAGAGRYESTVVASETPGVETLTAGVWGSDIVVVQQFHELSMAAVGVGVQLSPEEVVADGVSQTTVTAVPRNSRGEPVLNDPVAFSTNGDAVIGDVVDNGDGTYTATVTASTTAGQSWIYATTASGAAGQALLYERPGDPARVTLQFSQYDLPADGTSETTAFMWVWDAHDNVVPDAELALATDGDMTIGPITHQGTARRATVQASLTPGVETFTAAVVGTDLSESVEVTETRPPRPPTGGYWLADEAGGVYAFGTAGFHGSAAGRLAAPLVDLAGTRDNGGYWQLSADGAVFAFGNALFYGDLRMRRLDGVPVALVPTPTGQGYWVALDNLTVYAFGDARDLGANGGLTLNHPIVDMAATATGRGFWLVASDGGVFAFGDAPFYGSTGALGIDDVVSIQPTAAGNGYWIGRADGSVHAFGAAVDYGSATGALDAVAIDADPSGGLYVAEADGTVHELGWADDHGDRTGSPPASPVVAFDAF